MRCKTLADKCEFVVTLDSPIQWKEVDDVFIVTGVALAPGTYQGIDGAKIQYDQDVVKASCPSLLGIDYMTAHSPNGKFGGTVVGNAIEADTLLYKAVVSKPEAIANIKKGFGTSIEANVKTEWDKDKEVWRAVSVEHKMLCQTDKPACPTSRVLNVKQVKLEKENMGNEGASGNTSEGQIDTLKAQLQTKDQEIATLKTERDAAKTELATLQGAVQQTELARLSDGIKSLDKNFDIAVFLKDIVDFPTKRIVLSKHLEVLQGIKAGTVKLSVANVSQPSDLAERTNRISKDFFGIEFDKAAKAIVGGDKQ